MKTKQHIDRAEGLPNIGSSIQSHREHQMSRLPEETGQLAARPLSLFDTSTIAVDRHLCAVMTADDFNPLEGAVNNPVLRHLSGTPSCLSICRFPVLHQMKTRLSSIPALQTASHLYRPAWTPKTQVQLVHPTSLLPLCGCFKRVGPTFQDLGVRTPTRVVHYFCRAGPEAAKAGQQQEA